jgi:hypothetical protein
MVTLQPWERPRRRRRPVFHCGFGIEAHDKRCINTRCGKCRHFLVDIGQQFGR